LVLVREINTLARLVATGIVTAALRQGASAGGELGRNGSILFNPVRKGVFTVLNDTATMLETSKN